jgi:hypothetical protein
MYAAGAWVLHMDVLMSLEDMIPERLRRSGDFLVPGRLKVSTSLLARS